MSGLAWAASDDDLIGVLGHALRADPPPPDVLRQARASFAWRDLAAEIARLEFDSAIDDGGLARVRGVPRTRRLYFHGERSVVSLELHLPRRNIVGRIDPAEATSVELRSADGSWMTQSDERGYFAFDRAPSGAASLRWSPAGERQAIETEWVTL
jgi:hypothetical protein